MQCAISSRSQERAHTKIVASRPTTLFFLRANRPATATRLGPWDSRCLVLGELVDWIVAFDIIATFSSQFATPNIIDASYHSISLGLVWRFQVFHSVAMIEINSPRTATEMVSMGSKLYTVTGHAYRASAVVHPNQTPSDSPRPLQHKQSITHAVVAQPQVRAGQ